MPPWPSPPLNASRSDYHIGLVAGYGELRMLWFLGNGSQAGTVTQPTLYALWMGLLVVFSCLSLVGATVLDPTADLRPVILASAIVTSLETHWDAIQAAEWDLLAVQEAHIAPDSRVVRDVLDDQLTMQASLALVRLVVVRPHARDAAPRADWHRRRRAAGLCAALRRSDEGQCLVDDAV